MKIDNAFQVVIDENDAVNAMLCGIKLKSMVTENSEWIDRFNLFTTMFDFDYNINFENIATDPERYIAECPTKWNMPAEYNALDIDSILLAKCKTVEQQTRVSLELSIYRSRELYPLLRFLFYFIDTIRKNNILLGVGRGSSVASYVLFLIGIHKVDSLKYNLDIGEFLK